MHLEKRAFLETLVGMAIAHTLSNLAIKKTIQSEKGTKFLKKILADRDKPLNPITLGFLESLLGPEFGEIHQKVMEKKLGESAKKVFHSKVYSKLRSASTFAPTLTAFSLGIPFLPDLTAVNNIRYVIARKSSEPLKKLFVLNAINSGLKKGRKRIETLKSLVFSPALGMLGEYAADIKHNKNIKTPKGVRFLASEIGGIPLPESIKGQHVAKAKDIIGGDKNIQKIVQSNKRKLLKQIAKSDNFMDKAYTKYRKFAINLLRKSGPGKLRNALKKLVLFF